MIYSTFDIRLIKDELDVADALSIDKLKVKIGDYILRHRGYKAIFGNKLALITYISNVLQDEESK